MSVCSFSFCYHIYVCILVIFEKFFFPNTGIWGQRIVCYEELSWGLQDAYVLVCQCRASRVYVHILVLSVCFVQEGWKVVFHSVWAGFFTDFLKVNLFVLMTNYISCNSKNYNIMYLNITDSICPINKLVLTNLFSLYQSSIMKNVPCFWPT